MFAILQAKKVQIMSYKIIESVTETGQIEYLIHVAGEEFPRARPSFSNAADAHRAAKKLLDLDDEPSDDDGSAPPVSPRPF
jgi:hypothetical protein